MSGADRRLRALHAGRDIQVGETDRRDLEATFDRSPAGHRAPGRVDAPLIADVAQWGLEQGR